MWVAYDYKVKYKMSAKMIFRRGRVSLIAFTVCLTGLSKLRKWLVLTLLWFSHSVMSNSLQPHGLQHTRLPCPSPSPGACSNSCPLNQWCHTTISSSIGPFSSCLQSFPASGSFPMSQSFALGGQSIGVPALASVFPMNTQDSYPLGWTGWISLQSKGLSRVFSNNTVQKHQFFGAQLSLQNIRTSLILCPILPRRQEPQKDMSYSRVARNI